jgi:UDP-N-acetyl-2-amino-2-deoxyglucuronate dehydrogenase
MANPRPCSASDPEVDFTIVMTPPNARKEIISALVGAGKHILLEKSIESDGAAPGNVPAPSQVAVPVSSLFVS